MGIKQSKSHHPLLPVSCNLRTPTASDGNNTAKEYSHVKTFCAPIMLSRIARMIEMIKLNRTNIQYSLRLALP
jgi:hypothetical protein